MTALRRTSPEAVKEVGPRIAELSFALRSSSDTDTRVPSEREIAFARVLAEVG